MSTKTVLAALGLLAAAACPPPAAAQIFPSPQYDRLGAYRAAGEDPYYHVNRYGYGNYVQGPDGAYGGYPAGSAGAIELQNEHDLKCRYVPESC